MCMEVIDMIEYLGREHLIATAVKNKGNWEKIFADLKARRSLPSYEISRLLNSVKSKATTIIDEDYPAEIRDACPRPPFVLFYYGDLSIAQDKDRILTVVGSRKPEEYAIQYTREICEGAAKNGYIVASGLARGIDTVAAEATSGMPGHSIAVLGCGLDVYYPPENRLLQTCIAGTGLLLSEYPEGVSPAAEHFPARNRILASISKGTFIGEAMPHSGTLITAAFVLTVNHDLAVLPTLAQSPTMNNSLIKTGAALVENVDDILSFMSCAPRGKNG